jgi:hypothetical protein
MSVNLVQAIFATYHRIFALVIFRRNIIIINQENPGIATKITEEAETATIGISIIGESLVITLTCYSTVLPLTYFY